MLHRGAKQCNGMLALTLELNIMVNSTGMSLQHVCLLLKSYIVDVDDQGVTSMLSHAGNGAAESCW
jgi:hypothetical protein